MGQPNALNNPTAQTAIPTAFTTICGLFATRIHQSK